MIMVPVSTTLRTQQINNSSLLLQTRQFDRQMSNGMAALYREDTTPQSVADAYCSSVVQ